MSVPPTPADLDRFRDQADRFLAEQDEEFYLHYAGLKESLDLEGIYERHADLTTLERARWIGTAVDGGPAGVRELWRFACEGAIGNLTKTVAQQEAEREATLEATVLGESIPLRELRPRLANEPDRDRRAQLEAASGEATEQHLVPLQLEAIRVAHEAARELGGGTYADLYTRRFGWQLERLGAQCRDFLDSTERLYEEKADRLFRDRVGIGLAEARRWDTPRLLRGVGWDKAFPADRMVPALEWTLSGLGVDLRSQPNVELDIEPRPQKDPRAFCVAIEVPDRVVLVMKPMGGPDDWNALFHEAGHAEHFAHTSADLRMEEKRLGDNAVTEGWAMLLQHVTDEPGWLKKMLDFPRPTEYAAEGAAVLLFFVRRYCAKLLYELELHAAADVRTMRGRYVELLGDALKIEPNPANYLADVDAGFYVSSYLRSWAFEAQVRDYLRSRYGSEWFTSARAGGELRELWSEGQRSTAEEMVGAVTGGELDLESVADRIREALA